MATDGRLAMVVAALAAVLILVTPSAGQITAEAYDEPGSFDRMVDDRVPFGLPVDSESLRQIQEPGVDVGSPIWGIPMTSKELDLVDLVGRMAFADFVGHNVIPWAAESPSFAGAYIDQAADGGLVVLLTSVQPELEAELIDRMPDDPRRLTVRIVTTSYMDLRVARDKAWELDIERAIGTPVRAVAIDARENMLRLRVAPEPDRDAAATRANLEALLGVRVAIVSGPIEQTAACNSRNDCHSPFRSGVRITNPVTSCTMGFHIARNAAPADLQFVSTGHCGNAEYSHPSYGAIGSTLENEYGPGGWDIMRVQMANSQGTNRIFAEDRRVHGRRDPVQGEAVCASLRIANVIDCGTIADADHQYVSGDCACQIVAAADTTGINIVGGDSGAPVYVRSDADSATAIGLAATQTSDFISKLGAPFAHWGAGVVVAGP